MFSATLPTFALVFLGSSGAGASDPAALLARMDTAAAKFQGMTATVDHLTHTAVIDDDSRESGTAKLRKVDSRDVQGLLDFTAPDRRIILFKNRKAQIYTPADNTVQVYDLGNNSEKIEQFFMLGFGTPRSEIERAYQVTLRGSEKIQGRATTRIELVPRSADAKKMVTRVELWIADDGDYPVQEKVYQPSGDYSVWVYRDVRINPNPPLSSDLGMKLPKDVHIVHPQS